MEKNRFVKWIGKYNVSKDEKVKWEWETKEDNKDFKLKKGDTNVANICKFRRINTQIERNLTDQLTRASCLARITSRPGQSGRCDGLVLEGKELEFYLKKLPKRR